MGKVNAEPTNQTSISHFSHPHPLHLLHLQAPAVNSNCSACKIQASGPVYICTPCNFLLHQKCYELPKQITHEFHKSHTLVLQPKPAYSEGLFNCDACGKQGDGFSYHCSPCGIDLHSACACLPMQFSHHCHPHQLSLTFSSPYPGKSFSCDICKRVESNTWLYRCNVCEFDVHLSCVKSKIPNVSNSQNQVMGQAVTARSVLEPPTNFTNPSNGGGYGFPSAAAPVVMGQAHNQFVATPANFGVYGVAQAPRPVVMGQAQNQFVATAYPAGMAQMPAYYNGQPAAYGAVPMTMNNGLRDQVVVGAANGVASGVSQAATQALIQGLLGGGGGGGAAGGGGGVGYADFMGGDGSMMGGSSLSDGGYSGTDGGYGGGDGTY